MSKKLNPDYRALKACVKALDKVCTPRMVIPTLDYLWDRFVLRPPKGVAHVRLRSALAATREGK